MARQRLMVCILVFLGVSSVRADGKEGYPSWFVRPPTPTTCSVAVGYSPLFFCPDSSVAYATRNGLDNLAREAALRIRYEEGFMTVPGGLRAMGRIYDEEVDSTTVQTVQADSRLLVKASVGRSVFVLVGGSCVDPPAVVTKEVSMPSRPPKWVHSPPKKSGYVYAIGVAPLYYYEIHSWQEAEQSARVELARIVLSQIKGLSKIYGGYLQTVTVTETDVTLRGVQVVSRWLDRKDKAFYVLCRMPLRH